MLAEHWHKLLKITGQFILFFGLFLQVNAYADTFWVSPDGSNLNAGSEAEPFQTITFALTQVAFNDTVLVMGGVYAENVIINNIPDFVLAGASVVDTAFIIAPAAGPALSLLSAENSRAMVIENLCLSHNAGVNGVGLSIDGGSPTIRGLSIRDNNNPGADGGGIFITSSDINSRPLLEDNRIFSNQAAGGAGIYCESTDLDLKSNLVFNNEASADGGAVAVINSLSVDISENEFYRNKAVNGAAVFIDANTAGQLISNRVFENYIYENVAQNNGGAIYTEGNAQNNFQRNTFAENSAGASGGAIFFNMTSNAIINNNITVNNTAGQNGGGFAFIDLGNASVNLWSNTITGNKALNDGGAIYIQNSNLVTVGGAVNQTNNLFHNRAAGQLNNITSNALISNLNLSYNYWGSTNQQLISQHISIPDINATWTTFSDTPQAVEIKLQRTMHYIWFADGKLEFDGAGLQPTGDSTLVILTHPDSSFNVDGVQSLLPKIYAFDWQNVMLTGQGKINFYLDSTELDLLGNPFFLNLRILAQQDTAWNMLDTTPLKEGTVLVTDLAMLNNHSYTIGLDERANTPILVVEPTPNQAGVNVDDPLQITFLQTMNASTVNPQNISLRGDLSGKRDFLFDYDSSANIAWIMPQDALRAGETVTVTLNDAFTTEQNDNLLNGMSWQYRISALRGSADFVSFNTIQQRAGNNQYQYCDFDDDLLPELIELSDGALAIFNLADDGTYSPLHTMAVDNAEKFVLTADLNNDFRNEVILFSDSEIKAYNYNVLDGFSSDPVFSVTFNNNGQLMDVKISDLNNDGVLDMAVLRNFIEYRQLDIYSGAISGQYNLEASFPVFLSGFSDKIDFLDWNMDGLFDLVASRGSAANNLALITNQRNAFASLINTLFEINSQTTLLTANVWNDLLFQDKKEIIIAGASSAGNLLKLFNVDEKGNFVEIHRWEFQAPIANCLAADFNSDGFNDLAVSLSDGNISLLLSDDAGLLNAQKTINSQIAAIEIRAVDFDADGDLDIFVSEPGDGITSWQILENVSRNARSWFVNSTSDGGDGSLLNPFKTINQALAVSFEGDSIFVTPGFYSENLSIKHDLIISSTDTSRFSLAPDASDRFAEAVIHVQDVNTFQLLSAQLEQEQNSSGSKGLVAENADSLLLTNIHIRNFDEALTLNSVSGTINGFFAEDNNFGVRARDSRLNVNFSNFERNSQSAFSTDNTQLILHQSDFHDNGFNGGSGLELLNGSEAELFEVSLNQNHKASIFVDNSLLDAQFVFVGESVPDLATSDGIGIVAMNNARLQIQNSVIADNFKIGITLDNSNATILNSIFANNDSLGLQSGGGLFALNNSTADIRNSIFFANNTAINAAASNVAVNYNDFYLNNTVLSGTNFGTGNLNENPLLVFMYNPIGPEVEVNDFRHIKLAAGSALIDKGDPLLTNGASDSRSDIGLFGNLGLPYVLESIPQGAVESQDSALTISWASVSPAEQGLWAATALFRDTVAAFEPDTTNLLSIQPKSLLSYTENVDFGKEYFYRLAFIDSNGGTYGYGETLSGRIDFKRLDLSVQKLAVQLGQGDTLVSNVTVRNGGTLPIVVSVSEPAVDWLEVLPQQRILQRGESNSFRLRFNAIGLAKDSLYSTVLQFAGLEDPTVSQTLSVEMLVSYRDLTAPLTIIQGAYPDTINQAGFSVNFNANDSALSTIGTPTDLLRFVYRFAQVQDSGPVVVESDTTVNRRLDFYPLADGRYYFEVAAIDTAGNGGLEENSKSLTFNVKASDLSVAPKFWQMITVPRKVLDAPEKISSDKIAALRHWQDGMYAFSSPDSVLPGKSYWIFTTDRIQLDLNRFDLVESDEAFSVELAEGWNMIGNPWSWNIAIDKLTFADGSGTTYSFQQALENELIDPGIYTWQISLNNRGYILETSGRLNLNTGYWLKAGKALTLNYDPTPEININAAFPKATDFPDVAEFDAIIRLKVQRGKESDNDNYFGLCADRSVYPYYLQNAQEPPAIYDNMRLFAQIDGLDVTTNLVRLQEADSLYIWNILVQGAVSEEPAQITWEMMNPASGMQFYLYHLESAEWLNVNEKESFVIANTKVQNHFKLYATKDQNFEPEILPTKFELSQNYPNPFNPSTTIKLAVPYFADGTKARIDVYDVLGRKVRNLLNRRVKSGVLEVQWNGQTASGISAASGIYFYHVEAADFNASRKMILIR